MDVVCIISADQLDTKLARLHPTSRVRKHPGPFSFPLLRSSHYQRYFSSEILGRNLDGAPAL